MLLSLVSAADLEWQAEFRYRLETGKSDSLFYKKANTINYARSRISLKFINGPVTAFAQLQDSRILGRYYNSPGITQASGLKIEFHQIYFQVNNLLKRNWTMRFGRFEMPLGSKRLFSNNNWSNYGRAFEGITSFNQNKFGSLNTFYLINDENSKYSDSDEYDAIIRGFYLSPFLKHIPFVKINQLDFYLYNYIYMSWIFMIGYLQRIEILLEQDGFLVFYLLNLKVSMLFKVVNTILKVINERYILV